MHWDTFKQDSYSTVGIGDVGSASYDHYQNDKKK